MFSFFRKVHTRFVDGKDKRTVILYEDNYLAIRDGVGHTGHPEIETHFHLLKQAIEAPNQVKKDKDNPKRLCYYAWFCGGMDYPNNHMKVVLEDRRNGTLELMTAYFVEGFKPGEQEIWTQ